MYAWSNALRWSGAGLLATAAIVYFCAVLIAPEEAALALLSDDAYYYFKIARSLAQGSGSTFDGIAPTNGYHPLWMICIVATSWVAEPDLMSPLQIVMVGSGLLALLTLLLVYRVVDRFLAPGYGFVAVGACLLPHLLTSLINGLETGILALSLVFLVWACCRWSIHEPDAGTWKRLAFGALLGVAFLCRLDSVFLFAAAIGLNALSLVAARTPLLRIPGRLAAPVAGFAVFAAPFFVWNLTTFGHLMPISGLVKSSLPVVRSPLVFHSDMLFGFALVLSVVGLVGWVVVAEYRRGRTVPALLDAPVLMLAVACVFHYLHVFLFLTWGVYWWHFTVYGLTCALALSQVASLVGQWRPGLRPVVVSLAIAMAGLGIVLQVQKVFNTGQRHGGWLRAAEWARQHSAPEDVFALKDAGLFGYFSQRSVVNLDGKANGYEYQEYLVRDDVEAYLRKVKVKYVAEVNTHCQKGRCVIMLPRANEPILRLEVSEEDEVYRSIPLEPRMFQLGDPAPQQFMIWRFLGRQRP
jgi:hypothetical protein